MTRVMNTRPISKSLILKDSLAGMPLVMKKTDRTTGFSTSCQERPAMLTDAQLAIVKSTVPLLESGGEALTTHFYKMLMRDYPQVRPLFNRAHQASGDQPRALANGVLMYARHIDRLEELGLRHSWNLRGSRPDSPAVKFLR